MSKDRIQISIIVPFYDVESYFRQFLDSLLPIGNNCEVLLVDDGSKDFSINIATEFSDRFNNVEILRKTNGGLSSARNYGLQFAKGDYVIFFDSDDYIENKTIITKMAETANSNNSDIVVAPYYEFLNLDKKKFRFDKVNFDGDLLTLDERMNKLFKNDISFAVWNKMYKLDFLKNNNLQFKEGVWFEDLDFIFKAFFYANKISKVENVLMGYRQRDGSIMRTISPKVLDKIYVLDELYLFLEKNNKLSIFYEKFKILYLRMVFSVIYSVVINRGDKLVKREILNKVFEFPFFNKIIKENLIFTSFLSKAEKFLFYFIKYKIINRRNVVFMVYFNRFRKF